MMMMINCVFLSFSSRQSWQLRKECSLTLPSPQHHEVRQMSRRRSLKVIYLGPLYEPALYYS